MVELVEITDEQMEELMRLDRKYPVTEIDALVIPDPDEDPDSE